MGIYDILPQCLSNTSQKRLSSTGEATTEAASSHRRSTSKLTLTTSMHSVLLIWLVSTESPSNVGSALFIQAVSEPIVAHHMQRQLFYRRVSV